MSPPKQSFQRLSKRTADQLREVKFTPNYYEYAEGAVLVEFGNSRVICTATIEENVPKWLKNSGKGWITAEYGMLPRSTPVRISRERSNVNGRTQEIQRLIGRSLRAVTDLEAMGEISILIDCDVIQADGGTRCASICGSFVALAMALQKGMNRGTIRGNRMPLKSYVAAVSVGIVGSDLLLDLDYSEDSTAMVDCNFVMTQESKLIEVQGTAEGDPFSFSQFSEMYQLAEKGIKEIVLLQKNLIKL